MRMDLIKGKMRKKKFPTKDLPRPYRLFVRTLGVQTSIGFCFQWELIMSGYYTYDYCMFFTFMISFPYDRRVCIMELKVEYPLSVKRVVNELV